MPPTKAMGPGTDVRRARPDDQGCGGPIGGEAKSSDQKTQAPARCRVPLRPPPITHGAATERASALPFAPLIKRVSRLGRRLRQIKNETGHSLADLTVLSSQNDPFRLDTPTFHEAGRWFRDQMRACGLLHRGRPIHNRGVHYAIVGRGDARLPSGKPYVNDADCWAFLELKASKAARWFGYVPFEAIIDARNTEPIIRLAEHSQLVRNIRIATADELPTGDELHPTIAARYASDLRLVEEECLPRQRYRLVLFGEKTSLDSVLGSIAEEFGADLYLPSGEISDTLLATMARTGAEDGREMIVLVFADCDPAGYQMAVSIGHKLRALREVLYASVPLASEDSQIG